MGGIKKEQRVSIPLTLRELAAGSGVSASHLGRIERRERFPSARVLRKIAKSLGFGEKELMRLAGYLSPASDESEREVLGRLDSYVAKVLSQEPPEVQRSIVHIVLALKNIVNLKQ
jgi:transcriptional regulator with XRE-family HTH domain